MCIKARYVYIGEKIARDVISSLEDIDEGHKELREEWFKLSILHVGYIPFLKIDEVVDSGDYEIPY